MARDPERPEVVPQPGRSASCCSTTLRGHGPAVAGGRLRRRGAAEPAARARTPIRVIPTVSVTRYVTPLREGGSLPGIVEADDLGTYVCKFRGAGPGRARAGRRGRRRRAGPPDRAGHAAPGRRSTWTPRSPATRPTRRSRTCSTPARAQPRRRLPARVRSASTATVPTGRRTSPRKVLWLDAFCANVDRTWRNPNLLFWHGDLWVIDHGAALYFHHGWGGGVTDPDRFAAPAVGPDRPRLARHAAGLRRGRRRDRRPARRATSSPRCSPRCPTPGSSRCPAPDSPDAVRDGLRRLPGRAARRPVSGSRRRAGGRRRMSRSSPTSTSSCAACRASTARSSSTSGSSLYCQAADFLDVALERRRRPARVRSTRGSTSTSCARRSPSSRACVPATSAGERRRTSRSAPASASSWPRAAPCSSPARCTAASPPTRPASSSTCSTTLVG